MITKEYTMMEAERPATQNGSIGAGIVLCLLSMSSVQFGAALSTNAIAIYGPTGASWIRLSLAAIVLMAAVRPPVRCYNRQQWTTVVVLGLCIAFMTACFFEAIHRIPLGLAIAIDFLGPLSVAVLGYGLSWRLVWPLIAAFGIVSLSYDGEQWVGNTAGVLFAISSGVGWALYIIWSQKVGTLFQGLEGLAVSMAVAALVSAPFGMSGTVSAMSFSGFLEMAGLALLVPLLPYALEMIALRRMTAAFFGILMSLEPAIGALAGFLVLNQSLTAVQILGIIFVVSASAGATLSSRQP